MLTPFDYQSGGEKFYVISEYARSRVILFAYARHAIIAALKLLNLNPGEVVYVPAFICKEVVLAIYSLNLKIIYYELDEKLNPIINDDISSKAILVVNYFGFPQDLGKIKAYCKKHNSYLIEDNAQGFMSKNFDGTLLGTIGDFGILSIRKSVFVPNGAALLINNEQVKKKCVKGAETRLTNDDIRFKKKRIIKKIIKLTTPRLGTLTFLLREKIQAKKFKGKNESNSVEKYLSPLIASGSIPIDQKKEKIRRRALFSVVKSHASKFGFKPLLDLQNEGTVPYAFAFNAEDVSKFSSYLIKRNFFILNWPDLPDDICKNQRLRYKNVWIVPFLW